MQEDEPAEAPARTDAALALPLHDVFGLLVDEYCQNIRRLAPIVTKQDGAAFLKEWHDAGIRAVRHMDGLHRLATRLSGGPVGATLPRREGGEIDFARLRAEAKAEVARLRAELREG